MSVLTLQAARKHLNISGVQNDDELQDTIDAAEQVISNHVGPLAPTTVTERVYGSDSLLLAVTPVISVTSVTPYLGTTLTVGDLHLEADSGLVSFLSTGRTFSTSTAYTVVYQAGRATCPPDLLQAVKELTKHLWESQRGARPINPMEEPSPDPGAAYLLPYRVQELLAPHIQVVVA